MAKLLYFIALYCTGVPKKVCIYYYNIQVIVQRLPVLLRIH